MAKSSSSKAKTVNYFERSEGCLATIQNAIAMVNGLTAFASALDDYGKRFANTPAFDANVNAKALASVHELVSDAAVDVIVATRAYKEACMSEGEETVVRYMPELLGEKE